MGQKKHPKSKNILRQTKLEAQHMKTYGMQQKLF